MQILGLVALSIFGFYDIRLLASFKSGMLEEGWKKVTFGAIILAVAQIPFVASSFIPSQISSLLGDVGMLLRFIGILFLILGFRAQYKIWRLDKEDASLSIAQTYRE